MTPTPNADFVEAWEALFQAVRRYREEPSEENRQAWKEAAARYRVCVEVLAAGTEGKEENP